MTSEMMPEKAMLADVSSHSGILEDQLYGEGEYDRVNSHNGRKSNRFLVRYADSTISEPLNTALYDHPMCDRYKVIQERQGYNDSRNITIQVHPCSDVPATERKLAIHIIHECFQDISASFKSLSEQVRSQQRE